MLFNSFEFLLFFPIVTALYFIMPHRFRWLLLLIASCVFYMAFVPVYILILALTIVIDYFAGLGIENSTGKMKKALLLVSILATCLVLGVFKYVNFFNANFAHIAQFFHLNYPIGVLQIILPIGLSFHTFQSLCYVIEVYRGHQKAARHFGIYALYVMFYPQLVAGPIERPQNLLHQFYEPHTFDYQRVIMGLKLMAWGLFKKIVIADRLSVFVNMVYADPHQFSSLYLITATVFFAFQIYCDFSGYSDIAIGAAQVMGFKLMTNFDRPYFSKSISEFWKRWHISLSTWFRDYVYIPLGGNRKGDARWQFNLFLTFLISGLWHGANWTYVVWGALNGIYLIMAIQTQGLRERIAHWIGIVRFPRVFAVWQVLSTFALVCVAWVFFRANSLHDAVYILTHLFSDFPRLASAAYLKSQLVGLGSSFQKAEFGLGILMILVLLAVHYLQRTGSLRVRIHAWPVWMRWSLYYACITAVILFGAFKHEQFIYFQF